MSKLAKSKRRIKRLEKCMESVRDLLAEELECRFRFTVRDDEEAKLLTTAINRINRTLK